MTIKNWLNHVFGCDPDYTSTPVDDEKHFEKKIERAEEAIRQADTQLIESQRIHEEGKVVGQTARRIRYENHFTSRIRQALEGK